MAPLACYFILRIYRYCIFLNTYNDNLGTRQPKSKTGFKQIPAKK